MDQEKGREEIMELLSYPPDVIETILSGAQRDPFIITDG